MDNREARDLFMAYGSCELRDTNNVEEKHRRAMQELLSKLVRVFEMKWA